MINGFRFAGVTLLASGLLGLHAGPAYSSPSDAYKQTKLTIECATAPGKPVGSVTVTFYADDAIPKAGVPASGQVTGVPATQLLTCPTAEFVNMEVLTWEQRAILDDNKFFQLFFDRTGWFVPTEPIPHARRAVVRINGEGGALIDKFGFRWEGESVTVWSLTAGSDYCLSADPALAKALHVDDCYREFVIDREGAVRPGSYTNQDDSDGYIAKTGNFAINNRLKETSLVTARDADASLAGGQQQAWQFEPAGDGFFYIRSTVTGYYLGYHSPVLTTLIGMAFIDTSPSGNLQTRQAFQWKVEPLSNNFYQLSNRQAPSLLLNGDQPWLEIGPRSASSLSQQWQLLPL